MIKLLLVRHGQSVWNKENRFTGWHDVDLSEKGVEEAHEAAKLLIKEGFTFDEAFTSVLLRGYRTLNIILSDMGLSIPVKKSWRLNERFYGALQGLNKSEMAEKHGAEQVHIWRRSFDVRPPQITEDDDRFPGKNPLYKDVPPDLLPTGECLKDTVARVLPYWDAEIVPELKKGKRIIIAAHGNSLRALVMHLDKVSPDEIMKLNIPTGIPLVYELDDNLKPIKHYYLGNQEKARKAAESVANQAANNQ